MSEPYTVEAMRQLLVAGAQYTGTYTIQAAVHLLTFTELPHHRGFDRLVEVEEVGTTDGRMMPAAFVRDWKRLPKAPTAHYMGSADHRLLALAVSLAAGQPVDLRDKVVGLGSAHARRVVEAFAIAAGVAHLYAVARPLGTQP